jgi:hypothetical protein
MKVSGSHELIYEDVKRVLYNLAKFSLPLLVAFLLGLQQDLVPVQAWKLFVLPALIQGLMDLYKKWDDKITYMESGKIVRE